MDHQLVFGVKEGDQITFFTLIRKKFNSPPYGVLTAEEAISRPEVVRHLVENKGTFKLIRPLTDEEVLSYKKVLADEEKVAKAAEKEAAEKAAEEAALAEANEYFKAVEIVEAYQAKYPERFVKEPTDEEIAAKKAEELAAKKAAEEAALAEAQELAAIQAQYEELTGKKPGNKKAETLLKEIEQVKSKSE